MENKFIEKAKDPLFRKEVYEYLIQCVTKRIQLLKAIQSGKGAELYNEKLSGFICINLQLKYSELLGKPPPVLLEILKEPPSIIGVTATGFGYPNELNIMLPELERPDIPANNVAWWGDCLEGNELRLIAVNNALIKVNKIITSK